MSTGPIQLETPDSPDDLYLYRTDDVDRYRPLFTGDVYQLNSDPERLSIVLQHPCALRVHGTELVDPLLLAGVTPADRPRSDWAKASPRTMPLPELRNNDQHYRVDFLALQLSSPHIIKSEMTRIASLGDPGICLLLQRWVNHNTRVIIHTLTFMEQIAGPLAEAELATEWMTELGDDHPDAELEFHDWIRASPMEGQPSRQESLTDPRRRAGIRRELAAELRGRR